MKAQYIIFTACLWASSAIAAINIDFTDETLSNKPNGYLGGWFTPQIDFDEWVGDGQSVDIQDGKLNVTTTNGSRHGAVVFDSSSLDGAGDYILTFSADMIIGEAATNNNGHVSIWTGSGYDLTGGSADALIVDTQNGMVDTAGNAIASELAAYTFQTSLVEQSIAFTYDGSGALILMLGAETSSWPFPEIDYHNIRIEKVIPELNQFGLVAVAAMAAIGFRRRRR